MINSVKDNIYKNNLFGKDEERSFLIDEKHIQGIIRGVDIDGRLELEIISRVQTPVCTQINQKINLDFSQETKNTNTNIFSMNKG